MPQFALFPRTLLPRLVALLSTLSAVTGTARAAAAPFEMNLDRVKVSNFGGSLAGSRTYFIPTVNIMVSASGAVSAQSKVGDANARATAKFYVKGLDKAVLQGLTQKVYDDLVAQMRAAGHTVLTYEDLQTHPVVSGHGKASPDSKWGLPTSSQNSLTYLLATPSDAQAFSRPINGPVFWLRDVAKEKDLIVLVPEMTLTVPTVYGEKSGGYKRAEASVTINPAMRMMGAMVYTINAKGGTANIQVQEHGTRLVSEVAGTVKKMSEDTTSFTSAWGRSTADYLFTLDETVFADGFLRAGTQLNSLIVSQIAKARK